MTTEGGVTRSVDYRNLGAEELGSIYESLLELHPVVDVTARTFALSTAGGNERKTTGSYYTPTSLITELLDSALEPVLDEAASAADPETALLAITVLDPACGSGHFLIAAAHRIAKRLASVRSGDGEPAPPLVQEALREVVGRCIHGIDVNEMAVELCKVSLWMEAMVPGKPLAFLAHRIVCGNALLGTTPELLAAGVPDDAFKALTGDDKAVVTSLKKRNKAERAGQGTLDLDSGAANLQKAIATSYAAIDETGDDNLAGLAAKERLWLNLLRSDEWGRARLAADAWCSALVALKTSDSPAITTEFVRACAELPPSDLNAEKVDIVVALREQYRFLHPHIAFPAVFRTPTAGEDAESPEASWGGGFSVVLGNPPWERVKLQEKEWFAVRAPEIAQARNSAERKRAIRDLTEQDPSLHEGFLAALRQAEAQSHFLRSSGRFPLCGVGRDINTASVFAEVMRATIRVDGFLAAVLPLGIATDDTTKHFFGALVESRCLRYVFGFENERFLFPGVDHRTLFCLLVCGGRRRTFATPEFILYARDVSELRDQSRRFSLTDGELAAVSPGASTLPVFRTRADADLMVDVCRRFPPLGMQASDTWGITTRPGHFHMSNDAARFVPRDELGSGTDAVQLYEAKMIHIFDHRYGTYLGQSEAQARLGTLPRLSASEHNDPSAIAMSRYCVLRDEWREKQVDERWPLVVREITRNDSERTVVPCAVPPVAVGHTLLLVETATSDVRLKGVLLAILGSHCFDYLARQKVAGLHLNPTILRQLPAPPPSAFTLAAAWDRDQILLEWMLQRVLELSYTSWDMSNFAAQLGTREDPPFGWIEERRFMIRAELDAALFHIYGLTRMSVEYVMDRFRVEREREVSASGEYRTQQYILEVYDAMAKAIASGEPYQTILDPPPADPSLRHPESTRPEWAERT